MADNDAVAMVAPPATIATILTRMRLTHPGDHALVMKLLPWIQTQRPKFMYTSVLSLAVLLQRMARAFACRSTNVTKPPATTTTATVANNHNNGGQQASSSITTVQPQQPPATQQQPASSSATAPPKRQLSKSKKKPFRSAKKLDLSPNVVASLRGFVADLAATIPLIQEHARRNNDNAATTTTRGLLTAVDIIDVCLELMEGEVVDVNSALSSVMGHNGKPLPNAAMELFRCILDQATSNKPATRIATSNPTNRRNDNNDVSSTMDQHKFKTFCVKTLESAQSRTIDVVESYYDFKLLWKVSYEQHAIQFVPTTTTVDRLEQQDFVWKLGYYIIWRRQEEHPKLCSRRERVLAVATSMIILCMVPFLYQKFNGESSNNAVTTPLESDPNSNNNNNKRPLEEGGNGSQAGLENDTAERSKMLKVSSEGGVSAGATAAANSHNNSSSADDNNGRGKDREKTLQTIVDAAGQASSFLSWAAQPKSGSGRETAREGGGGADIKLDELDRRLHKVVRDLSAFSTHPQGASMHNDWMGVLGAAIGMKDASGIPSTSDVIEERFKQMVELAFADMQHDEEQRQGTRVEAVSYIEEFTMMEQESVAHYVENLCHVTSSRQKEKNELIACIPMTSVPPEFSDGKAEIRNRAEVLRSMSEYQAKPVNPRLLMMMEESHHTSPGTFISPNRAVSPPVLTEPMELNEWTIALLSSLNRIQPSANLRSMLDQASAGFEGGDNTSSRWAMTITPLLNRFLSRMQQAVTGGAPGALPMTVNAEGEVTTSRRTQDTQLWAAILQLYYHSLESILFAEKRAVNAKVVLSAPFHEALLACSYLCVARAVMITGKMHLLRPENHQIYNILPITGSTPYTYLKVTESFLRALGAGADTEDETSKQLVDTFGTLPRILQKEVKNSEGYVIESLLWVRDSSKQVGEGCIVNTIAELKQANFWPPDNLKATLPEEKDQAANHDVPQEEKKPSHPETAFMSFVARKLLKVAYYRIQALCKGLSIPNNLPVASQVWLAYRYLLRNHVELLYGRHIDQWIVCTVYGICRVMKYEPAVTFSRLIAVYSSVRGKDLGESTCQAIVRHVKILDAAGDEDGADPTYGSTKMGDIVRLYNLVFVPIMKSYLLQSESLKKDASILKQKMAEKRDATRGETSREAVAPAPTPVTEGNVSVQLKLGGKNGGGGDGAVAKKGDQHIASLTATPMVVDQQENGTHSKTSSEYRTFITMGSFGSGSQAKSLSLANDMVARASVP